MISNSAKKSFEHMIQRAIAASPLLVSGSLRPMQAVPELPAQQFEKMVVLSVSSYAFRLTMMIHFSQDPTTRAHFSGLNGISPEDQDEQAFMDALRECGNICCGNLNRDLVGFFNHVGMSTPNIIDHRCAEFIERLGAQFVHHFTLLDASGPPFAVSTCVTAFSPLDFTGSFEAEEATGELEMF